MNTATRLLPAVPPVNLRLLCGVMGDKLTARKVLGIAVVLGGLLLLSGVDAPSFTARALSGDAIFIAAGSAWAGLGILLRRHRSDPSRLQQPLVADSPQGIQLRSQRTKP